MMATHSKAVTRKQKITKQIKNRLYAEWNISRISDTIVVVTRILVTYRLNFHRRGTYLQNLLLIIFHLPKTQLPREFRSQHTALPTTLNLVPHLIGDPHFHCSLRQTTPDTSQHTVCTRSHEFSTIMENYAIKFTYSNYQNRFFSAQSLVSRVFTVQRIEI